MADFDIETRTGWPDDLRIILERYPRETWADHVNIAGMASFWLDIHNGFRRAGEALRGSTGEFREGLVTPERFRSWYAPRRKAARCTRRSLPSMASRATTSTSLPSGLPGFASLSSEMTVRIPESASA